MSNTEIIPNAQVQSSIDPGWGRELTQMSAELELPHDVPSGCGAKAIAIMSFLRLQYVPRDSIGVAMSYVPDLSPEGTQSAEAEHDAMCFRQSPYTFDQRLKTGIGTVDTSAKTVEWSGVRMAETEIDSGSYVAVERLAPVGMPESRRDDPLPDLLNNNKWVLSPPGKDIYMGNHTAARLNDMIIDPGYEKDRPLSLEEWRECQGFSNAVLLSSRPEGAAVPFRAHAELMPPEQRCRYDALLKKKPA